MPHWEFIGRARELAELEKQYASSESSLVPIYGRRRVGKSELILHFKGKRPGIYFIGKQAPAALQIQEFMCASARALDQPLLAKIHVLDWRTALSEAVRAWSGPGKLILALDEFQWMAEEDRSLPSVLQELWDRDWQRSGKIMLILAGSYVGFMEREVLGSRNPLGGRRTAQIQLMPFPYWESAKFHPGYSRENQARVYFITGGVPLYLRAFKERLSVEQNIRDNFLNEFSPLFREPEFLLREELQGLEKFQAVLDALVGRRQALREVARSLAVDPRSITYQIDTLCSLGYVERLRPLTAAKASARDVRYTLGDALLRFWYRFVFPNLSRIRENPDATFKDQIVTDLDAYFGGCFERLCREALCQIYRREAGQFSFQVGEFWKDREVQFDVVGIRSDHWIDLGECKWGAVASASSLVDELESKVSHYPNPANATLGRMVFTRRPIRGDSRRARFFSLDDLYDLGY